MLFKYKFYLSQPLKLLKMYNDFGKIKYMDKSAIDDYAFEELKNLCVYCQEHVPYYRKLFKEIGFNAYEMKSFEDYKKIPVLNKDIVRKNAEELQSDEIGKMNIMPNSTSGSTGTPLNFYLDGNVNMAVFCKLWRMWNQSKKWRIGRVMLSVGGENPELAEKQWWFNPKIQFLYFISNHMTENNIEMYYKLMKKYKPKAMCGFPSAICLLGKHLQEAGYEYKFDTIFCHSENLLDYQKKFIEEFFGATVVNQYGNNEKAGLIHTCEKGHLHSQDDYAYHEIIDEDGNSVDGEIEGRLVCTNLYNYAMPLLRYDTRDIACFSEENCTCGSNFKVVKRITGRAADVIYTKDGRVISVIDTAFWDTDHIKVASIYQPEKGKMIIKIVKDPLYNQSDEDALMDGLRKHCGEHIDIEFKYVEEEDIPRTVAGKVRFIVSDVKEII